MLRRLAACGLLALLATGCISAIPAPAPPAPPLPPPDAVGGAEVPTPEPDDVAAIVEYWDDRAAAFTSGAEAGLAFVVARNHPQLPYLLEDCRQAWFGGAPAPTFRELSTLDAASIARDPEWTMPVGPLVDRDLGEGLYRMAVAFGYEGVAIADRVAEAHLQLASDGSVRNFLLCDTAQVTIASPPVSEVVAAVPAATATTPAATATNPATAPTTTTPTNPATTVSPVPTVLPTFPFPVDGGGGGGGGDGDGDPGASPSPSPGPPPDLDFCGAPPGSPGAGDYTVCPA